MVMQKVFSLKITNTMISISVKDKNNEQLYNPGSTDIVLCMDVKHCPSPILMSKAKALCTLYTAK